MTTLDLQLTPVTATDLDRLLPFAIRTFRDAFEHQNSPVQFEKYMANTFTRDRLADWITDPNYHIWFLMAGDQPAGYCTLKDKLPAYEAITGHHPIEIERFYVDTQSHRKGLGTQMMKLLLEKVIALGGDMVWLGVWEHNHQALGFYDHLGFVRVGQHDYWMGDDCQNDYLMAKNLDNFLPG